MGNGFVKSRDETHKKFFFVVNQSYFENDIFFAKITLCRLKAGVWV